MGETTTYKAQFGEDRMLEQIFGRRTGNCIEIGAFDGVAGSNTYHFEKIGWNCLLIEPNPKLTNVIRASRQCKLIPSAVGEKEGTLRFFDAENAETLSTVSLSEAHRERIEREGGVIRETLVPCLTLNQVLIENPMTPIDFVTIDVEGFELSVLKGFDLRSHPVRVLIIEDNFEGTNDEVADYLAKFDYQCVRRTGCNDWYVRDDDSELFTNSMADQIKRWKRKQRLLFAFKNSLVSRGLVAMMPEFVKRPLKQLLGALKSWGLS